MALSFVEEGPELFLVASDPNAIWARESIRFPVELRWADGREESRIAWPIDDPIRIEEVLAAFRHKYGEAAWLRYYRGRTRILALRVTATGSDRPPEEILRAEFDAIADRYTAAVDQNPTRRYLRIRSERRFQAIFRGQDPLLEMGPGTGIETLGLLRAGHRVLAVDISPRMLDELRRRAEASGLSANLETRLGSIGDLEGVLEDLPTGSIRGALSTFGALNLEPHLEQLPKVLARVLAPGAPFFAGILNRWGFTTVAFLLATGHPRVAVRRLHTPVVVDGFLYPLELRPFTSRQFASWFRRDFALETVESASVLVPPYWSAPLYSFWGAEGRHRLRRLDERLEGLFPFRDVGEYVFVTLRRAPRA